MLSEILKYILNLVNFPYKKFGQYGFYYFLIITNI